MKSTVIYLVLLVTLYSNTTFANGLTFKESDSGTTTPLGLESNPNSFKKPDLELDMNLSDTLLTVTINSKKTIEELIKEDNQIIESNVTTEAFSLDFAIFTKLTPTVKKAKKQIIFSNKNTFKV